MSCKVHWPNVPFSSYDAFYDWFRKTMADNLSTPLSVIDKSARPSSYLKETPKFDKEQLKFIYDEIKKIVKLPPDVYLMYSAHFNTIFSRWNTTKKCFQISVNNPVALAITYPPIMKTAMTHELGHILNGDCINPIPCHSSCANVCADVRINAAMTEEALDQLYSVIQLRKSAKCPFTPSRWYPKYGLPVNEAG
jgi:hypothetical protein